jgi:hypothetical protein
MGEPFRISHAAKQLAALLRKMKKPQSIGAFSFCGGGEIRTHGPVAQTPVFKTGAIDHSATPPIRLSYHSTMLLCFFKA